MSLTRTLILTLSAGCGVLFATSSFAQDAFPNRPVKIIVALPPGGSVDTVARLVAQHLAADLGQPFVLDNKAGASGQIGVSLVARAVPDGYTTMVSPASF